jgi:hydrogenase expression/formation protein HypC
MCVAVPAEVLEIDGQTALVNFGGVKKKVNILLVRDLKVGDYVLLHAGCAIEKLDQEEALKTLEIFKELLDS